MKKVRYSTKIARAIGAKHVFGLSRKNRGFYFRAMSILKKNSATKRSFLSIRMRT